MKKTQPKKIIKNPVLKKEAPVKPQVSAVPSASLRNKFAKFQDLLISKREDILKITKSKDAELSTTDIGDEADVASQTFEREMMFEVTDTERNILDSVEAALRKIERNEYGICESCRGPIAEARLHAMPWARNCIACQSRSETPR